MNNYVELHFPFQNTEHLFEKFVAHFSYSKVTTKVAKGTYRIQFDTMNSAYLFGYRWCDFKTENKG